VARNAALLGLASWIGSGAATAPAMEGAALCMGIAAALMVATLHAIASTLSAVARHAAARAAVEGR
jgi:hypothetical protein